MYSAERMKSWALEQVRALWTQMDSCEGAETLVEKFADRLNRAARGMGCEGGPRRDLTEVDRRVKKCD